MQDHKISINLLLTIEYLSIYLKVAGLLLVVGKYLIV